MKMFALSLRRNAEANKNNLCTRQIADIRSIEIDI